MLTAFTTTTVHSTEQQLPIIYSTPQYNFCACVN